MRIAGCIVRAARRRVNKLRKKIWSRWKVQRKAGAENYSRFGVAEFTARICIQQEYYKFLYNSVRILTLRSLTLYIYGAHILDVSRSHTTTQHSR